MTDPYRALAVAIIEQACKDRAKSFLLDSNNWAFSMVPELDGAKLYAQVEENFRRYNKWSAYGEGED